MNNTTHTPGPWAVNKSDTCLIMVSKEISPGVTQHIADVQYNKERYANAHLIAAAPAMYEALNALVEVFPSVVKMTPYGVTMDISKIHDDAKAALAQAEGTL